MGAPDNTMGVPVGGAAKLVQQALFDYQKARCAFVDSVTSLLEKDDPAVLHVFLGADIHKLLACPLIQDVIPSVQISALGAISKLTTLTDSLDSRITQPLELDKIIPSLSHEKKQVQCAGNQTLQHIARKNFACASAVMNTQLMEPLHNQLIATECEVKETTMQTIKTLVASSPDIANQIMDDNTLADLVFNLQLGESTDGLLAAVASALAETSAYSQPMAERVVAADAIGPIASLLRNPGATPKLRSNCLQCLGQIAKHSDQLAYSVVDADTLPRAVDALMDASPVVRSNAALFIHEAAKKTPQLAELVAADGGTSCLSKHLSIELGNGAAALPAVLSVGYMADFSAALAVQVVKSGGAKALVKYLDPSTDTGVMTAAAWSISTIARHGKDTALPLAQAGALPKLITMYSRAAAEQHREKAKAALKAIIHHCGELSALEPLLEVSTPPEIMRHLLQEFATRLPQSVPSKRAFITSGAMLRLQQIIKANQGLDDRALKDIEAIKELFPSEVVDYYA